VVIAMNLPSLDKYESQVKVGGYLIVNSSMVDRSPTRSDIHWVMVPGNEIAEELGDKRMTNMVLLGAMLANVPLLPLEAVEKSLREHLPERHHKLLPTNYKALREGARFLAEIV